LNIKAVRTIHRAVFLEQNVLELVLIIQSFRTSLEQTRQHLNKHFAIPHFNIKPVYYLNIGLWFSKHKNILMKKKKDEVVPMLN
jgi:hypothetical protein